METSAAIQASSVGIGSVSAARPGVRGFSRPLLSNAWIQARQFPRAKICLRKVGLSSRRHSAIRASLEPSDSGNSDAPIAPLKLESPFGQFLSQILVSHPHLVPAAIDQQLEQLQTDRDVAEQGKEESSVSGTDLVLYRRIEEVKANERNRALQEMLYALVVQKFMDADVRLVPDVTSTSPGQEDKLERVHSPEAYEMIQNHLTLVLGNRPGNSNTVAQISKMRVGQVYAASVMYGYFLKRVDQRFQLEKSMKTLPQGIDDRETNIRKFEDGTSAMDSSKKFEPHPHPHPGVQSWSASTGEAGYSGITTSRLRTYVMAFDGETLQRYATIRSKEAISIIESHTEALFGKAEIPMNPVGGVDSSKDELVKLSFGGLRRLVLEAVTFGSFLWDVESYVDSRYHFVLN
ncbi:UV-B-induced protein At3g17800, chloroplastic-like [Andrographis paniculata]|uniref:UV-B-induced protein At3g17800, chloroplastic-like n=1 Tax=Andrographis paniculata TaxID=175694 RepID=UPI0021E75AE4|nr:UV-B-induced protein At3g17800, chloroplastic-like [Andrographis paniculata]